jgi:hypothetical protein
LLLILIDATENPGGGEDRCGLEEVGLLSEAAWAPPAACSMAAHTANNTTMRSIDFFHLFMFRTPFGMGPGIVQVLLLVEFSR